MNNPPFYSCACDRIGVLAYHDELLDNASPILLLVQEFLNGGEKGFSDGDGDGDEYGDGDGYGNEV